MTQPSAPNAMPDLLNRVQEHLKSGERGKARDLLNTIPDARIQKAGRVPLLLRILQLASRADLPDLAGASLQRALEIEPENPVVLGEKANLDLARGNSVELSSLVEEVTGLKPAQDARYSFIRGKVAQAAGEFAQALSSFRRAAALMPDTPDYQMRLAQALAQDMEFDEARIVAEKLLEKRPNHTAMRAVLARISLQQGNLEHAEALIARVRQSAPRNLEHLMLQINILNAEGRAVEAAEILSTWVDQNPGQEKARIQLAKMLILHRDLEQAETLLRGLEGAPKPGTVVERAQLLAGLGHTDEAIEQLSGILDQGGAPPRVYVELARQLHQQKRHGERDEIIRRCLTQFPDNTMMSLFLLEQGSLPPEPELLERLFAKAPKPRAVKAIADSLHAVGDYDAMLAHLRKTANRICSAQRSALVARALTGQADLPLVIRYLQFALRRWPLAIELRNLLVQALVRLGRFDDALDVVDAQPLPTMTARIRQLETASKLFVHKADIIGAETVINEARQLDPDSRYYAADLMRQYISLGHYDKARFERSYNNILSADGHPHWAISLNGQLYGELEIEHRNGNGLDPEPMGVDRLAREILARPRSNIVALRFLSEWMLDARCQPGPDSGAEAEQAQRIPAKIYQYWNRSDRPAEVDRLMQSWQNLPGFEWQVFDRSQAVALLRSEFGPKWIRAFNMANNPAEEADLLRLCLLARFGGIWADADDRLIGNLDDLLGPGTGLVLFHEALGNAVGNNFMAARPAHPALVLAARRARAALLQRSNETTWSKTGPGLLSRSLTRVLAQRVADKAPHTVRILPGGVAEGAIVMHNRLSVKLGSQHWRQSGTGNRPELARDLVEMIKQA